jgi:dGTPase
MEAADDIAYCVSDIEDGIEKGLVAAKQFAEFVETKLSASRWWTGVKNRDKDARDIVHAMELLKEPRLARARNVEAKDPQRLRLTAMQDLRSGVIRFLARRAGEQFHRNQDQIIHGKAGSLLSQTNGTLVLDALKDFAVTALYSSRVVRDREITAQAVLTGLLEAYLPMMECERSRFDDVLARSRRDSDGRPIAREASLVSHISSKYRSVYREAVRQLEQRTTDPGTIKVMERVHRLRLIVDHIAGMTDEFALQSYHLISGVQINPYRH